MLQRLITPALAVALVATLAGAGAAQPMGASNPSPDPMASGMSGSGSTSGNLNNGTNSVPTSTMSGDMGPAPSGPDHGMPEGTAGGDGVTYDGPPDLQAAISLVTAGGPPGDFSITKALAALAGQSVADAEVAKLTKQYGSANMQSFVTVQNFAVDDAVKHAMAAGVKFPQPHLTGAALAKRVVGLGVVNGTYYEGTQLDHLVTNKIHEAVMDDIDQKYGAAADANYHRIADQAHYDLAQALGVKSVKLAAYH